jgi:Zn-dependent peptidase ImmA (M78 family)
MVDPVKEAQKLLAGQNIKAAPVPVEQIAQCLGARIVYKELSEDDFSGMIYSGDDEIVIVINSGHPQTRQRFTIAHEIGHLVLHRDVLGTKVHLDRTFQFRLHRDKRSSLGTDRLEIEANKFAAELLMPTQLIKREIENTYIEIDDDETIKSIAQKYHVSSAAMSIKLLETFESDFERVRI